VGWNGRKQFKFKAGADVAFHGLSKSFNVKDKYGLKQVTYV